MGMECEIAQNNIRNMALVLVTNVLFERSPTLQLVIIQAHEETRVGH